MGLGAAVTAFVASVLPESLAFAAPEIAGGLLGAAGGAGFGAITGGDPGLGALTGGITGGLIPAGGAIGGSLGGSTGAAIGDIAGGVAGGALGSGVTGGNVGVGALEGGLGGGVAAIGGVGQPQAGGSGSTAATAPTAGGSGGGSLSDFASSSLLNANSPDALGTAISATPPSGAATGAGGWNDLLSKLGAAPAATGTTAAAGGADPASSALLGSQSPDQLLGALSATGPAAASPAAATATPGNSFVDKLSALGAGDSGGAGTPTIAKSGGSGGLLDSVLGFPKAHPILSLLGGTAASQLLGPQLSKLTGSGMTSQEKALLANEGPAISAANALIPSLQTGVLPPGAEASVQSALDADIASIRSRYATIGQSGSSAEQQDIENAKQLAAGRKFQLAQQATTTGLDALGLNQTVYQTLLQNQLSRQQNLSNAFSNFFGSVGEGAALSGALKSA
jgi:hypothetical protein